jgi:hypothetical protein
MRHLPFLRLALCVLVTGAVLAGCGGGYGEVYVDDGYVTVPTGDVEVDNQTDLSGTFEDLWAFEMAPAGTGLWSGNLLSDVVYPGEIVWVGTADEDWYDAAADLDLGTVEFFDVFVEGGYTTTFEVY